MLVSFSDQLPGVINVPETFGNPPGISHATLARAFQEMLPKNKGCQHLGIGVGQQAGLACSLLS
jgi:hypothetical protein